MSLRFPYRRIRTKHPVVSLGGRRDRPRALVRITLIGPTGTHIENALLDTAADDTGFSERVAQALGVDLHTAPLGEASGAGLVALPVRYARVLLRITDGREQREWQGWVGFVPGLKHALLGYAGFL